MLGGAGLLQHACYDLLAPLAWLATQETAAHSSSNFRLFGEGGPAGKCKPGQVHWQRGDEYTQTRLTLVFSSLEEPASN